MGGLLWVARSLYLWYGVFCGEELAEEEEEESEDL